MEIKPGAEAAYWAWDHLLKEKVEEFEYFLESIKIDLSTAGLNQRDGDKFLRYRIEEIRTELQQQKKPRRYLGAGGQL